MTTQKSSGNKTKSLFVAVAGVGAVFGIWAITAFTSVMAQMDWSVAEVLRQYMVATGALAEQETLVDYYTHIKGIEYIIAVAFLGVFPAFYKYVNRVKAPMRTS